MEMCNHFGWYSLYKWKEEIIKLDEYEKEVVGIAEEISFYLQKSGATRADSQDIAQDVLVKF